MALFLKIIFYFKNLFICVNWRIITIVWWFLPYISMNWPSEYMYPLYPEPPSHLPSHPLPPGYHRAPALGALCLTSNSQWSSVLHMVMYMFHCYSLKSSQPFLLPLSPKFVLCVSFAALQKSRYHLPRFHICVLLLLLLLLSCFSRVWLCETPQTAAHQAPLSTGFSRQEYWSGLPLPSPIYVLICGICLSVSDFLHSV